MRIAAVRGSWPARGGSGAPALVVALLLLLLPLLVAAAPAAPRLADRPSAQAPGAEPPSAEAHNWPSFRGPNASGIADGADPPVSWDAEQSINVRWKVPIPGVGHSSPVVWGDRIFVTTAVSSDPASRFVSGRTSTSASAGDRSEHAWQVYALDKTSGDILWKQTAYEGVPKVDRHVKASYANPTPVTDGEHLVVSFGSEGLYCFDLDGELVWKVELGVLDGGWTPVPGVHWGFGSSPIIHEGRVVVQADVQNQAFLAAYDLDDGTQVWRRTREEDSSWSTPTIFDGPGRAEIIVSGTHYFRGYDALSGEELWRLADGNDVKIPTPVVTEETFFLGGGNSHERLRFYAVRAGARGEIVVPDAGGANGDVVWTNRAKPHIITPLLYRGHLYVCTDNGILTVYDAATGERLNRWRVGGRGGAFAASPVAADGRIYLASEEGDVFVMRAGTANELLSANPMGEVIIATPAITDRMIIVRGQHHLFGIGEE